MGHGLWGSIATPVRSAAPYTAAHSSCIRQDLSTQVMTTLKQYILSVRTISYHSHLMTHFILFATIDQGKNVQAIFTPIDMPDITASTETCDAPFPT